jgi:hypothetical protein
MVPVVAAVVACASAGRADPIDEPTRAAARAAAEDALARFDRGDYTGALDLFNRADALVHAPTLGLMAARCLEKLGRLVEASERYLAVTKAQLDPGAPASQARAQVTAEQERAALLPKVPSVVITLEGAAPGEARVTLDGKAVPPALIGLKRPTDPGSHRLEARRGAAVVSRDLVLKPGDAAAVTLSLPAAPATAAAPVDRAEDAGGAPSTSRGLGTLGWVGVGGAGLGGVLIVVGAITGGMAVSAKSSLDAAGCTGGLCPPSQQGAVSHYDTLRVASGASLIVGGLLAAGGATLAIVATRSRPEPAQAWRAPRVDVSLGLGRVGVEGTF